MADYQPATAEEENRRNPKNRFMFLFCHASEVDNLGVKIGLLDVGL